MSDVYYIPELKNNLLSISQFQEKGLAILIQDGACKVYHKTRGLIMQTEMTSNRMFVVLAHVTAQQTNYLNTTTKDIIELWHQRYGHLSHKNLCTLQHKNLVKGLP